MKERKKERIKGREIVQRKNKEKKREIVLRREEWKTKKEKKCE